jgi:precorrin-2 dehydrogenase/sirohydrochlorin ferrochelatase
MSKYPVFLDLIRKRVVVIGAGKVAARKVQSLLAADARVVVIAPHADSAFQDLCDSGSVELVISTYSRDFLTGAVLVIAATNDTPLNNRIYKDCQQLEILCNVVDVPDLCDFYVPAIVERGSLQIAIGTDGKCPAYSGHLRRKLEEIFTPAHGRFLEELKDIRETIIENVENPDLRKAILGELVNDDSFDFFSANGPEAWRQHAQKTINNHKTL